MKKIFFLLIIPLLIFGNDVFKKDYDEINRLNKLFPKEKIDLIYSGFMKNTGETKETYESYKDLEDIDWLLGLESFFIKSKESTFTFRDVSVGEDKKIIGKFPKIKESIVHLKKSTQNGNVLAAFLGEKLISKYFLMVNPSGNRMEKDIKEFIINNYPTFLNKLLEKNYCLGYLHAIVFREGDFLIKNDKKYQKLLNQGRSSCSNTSLPEYMSYNFNVRLAKEDAKKILEKRYLEKMERDKLKKIKQREKWLKNMADKVKDKS